MKRIFAFLVLVLFVTGCGGRTPVTTKDVVMTGAVRARQPGTLTPVPETAALQWRLKEQLSAEGAGVLARVVEGTGLLAPQALELAGAAGDRLVYSLTDVGPDAELVFRFQVLSTQGDGRLRVSARGTDGREIASVGFVFTGPVPSTQPGTIWIDRRKTNNYQGDWVSGRARSSAFFDGTGLDVSRASSFKVSLEIGDGQHALITTFQSVSTELEGLRLSWRIPPAGIRRGDKFTVEAEIQNIGGHHIESRKVTLTEPFGYGLIVDGPAELTLSDLAPGASARVSWQMIAQRPSMVNLGQPWPVRLQIGGRLFTSELRVTVVDPEPGRVFYVMTEDLEPMDSAGYPTRWGNANGWLDPEEFEVQLIGKAEALNRIAEKYGAWWTHYLAMPALAAGEWAATQSIKSDWRNVLEKIQESVRRESARGHEYSLHLHSDYDPEVPGNVLSYHPGLDGFWANHMRHGWAHSFPVEGDIRQRSTRTGILYYYQKILSDWTRAHPRGELVTARTGSFDFGNGTESEAMSMRAYRAANLWGNSDADGNASGLTSVDYPNAVYLTPPDDINAPATDLRRLGLVEFKPTPRQPLMYDIDNAQVMNAKSVAGMTAYTENGQVKPGIHAIVGFSHAMFVMGVPDWRSTSGGHYRELDDHLRFLKTEYVDKGLLSFGTGTDLVKAYLDYFTPEPMVFLGGILESSEEGVEYAMDFLGRDIPVGSERPHRMALSIPLRYRETGVRAAVLMNGKPLTEQWLSAEYREIVFRYADRQAKYTLRIGRKRGEPFRLEGPRLFEDRPPVRTKPKEWSQPGTLFPTLK